MSSPYQTKIIPQVSTDLPEIQIPHPTSPAVPPASRAPGGGRFPPPFSICVKMSSAASAGHSCDGTWSQGSCLTLVTNVWRLCPPFQKDPFKKGWIIFQAYYFLMWYVRFQEEYEYGKKKTWVECRLQVGFLRSMAKKQLEDCIINLYVPHLQVGHKWGTQHLLRSRDIPFSTPFFRKILKLIEWSVCDISPSWTSAFPFFCSKLLSSAKPRSSSRAMVFHHPALAPSYNLQMSHAVQWELILQALKSHHLYLLVWTRFFGFGTRDCQWDMGSHFCPTCNLLRAARFPNFADNFAPYLGCVQQGTTISNSLTAKCHRVPTHAVCTWNLAVLSAK